MHLAHSRVHHIGGHNADDGPVFYTYRLGYHIVALAVEGIAHTAFVLQRQVLAHLVKIRLVGLDVCFQIVEQVGHLLRDLALRLGGKHDIAIGANNVAIALSLISQAAQHVFQYGVIVADRQRGIGNAIHRDRLDLLGKHDLAHTLTGNVAGHDRAVHSVYFFQRRLHMRGISPSAADRPELIIRVEQGHLAVLPVGFFVHISAPLYLGIRFLCQLRKIIRPDLKDVPVALHKHGKGLAYLPIGGKQILRALVVDLALGIAAVCHNTEQHYQNKPCPKKDVLPPLFHKLFPLLFLYLPREIIPFPKNGCQCTKWSIHV